MLWDDYPSRHSPTNSAEEAKKKQKSRFLILDFAVELVAVGDAFDHCRWIAEGVIFVTIDDACRCIDQSSNAAVDGIMQVVVAIAADEVFLIDQLVAPLAHDLRDTDLVGLHQGLDELAIRVVEEVRALAVDDLGHGSPTPL